jgi:hypothetical protein
MSEINATFQKIKSLPCLVCQGRSVDVAHIKSRGSGGGDEEWNLMPLCRTHHTEQHKIGVITFTQKYIGVASYLYDHGWFVSAGKLINERHVTRESIPDDRGIN